MAEIVNTFSTNLYDPTVYADLPTVGDVYEVGINGVGYMLYDGHEDAQDLKYERATVNLDPARLATSDTPFTDAIERYSFEAWNDWVGGSGQTFQDRSSSLGNAYMDSFGVDPFTRGKLSVLPAMTKSSQNFGSIQTCRRVIGTTDSAWAKLYLVTGAKQLGYTSFPSLAPTNFTIAAATTIQDIATDGVNVYAAAGAQGVFKCKDVDPGAAWSTVQLYKVAWCAERVCGAYRGTGTTPNIFTTLNASGAEEVVGGRITLPSTWSINDITDGPGLVWFAAGSYNRGLASTGAVYVWDTSSATPHKAWVAPRGEVPINIHYVQGNVFIKTSTPTLSGYDGKVYRCTHDAQGLLTATLVMTMNGDNQSNDQYAPFFSDGSRVYFPYQDMEDPTTASNGGVGCVDLTSGGWARWMYVRTADGADRTFIYDGIVWNGQLVLLTENFTGGLQNLWYQSTGTKLPSGWLKTSLSDKASTLGKVLDQVFMESNAIATGEQIALDYTVDGGVTYIPIAAATMAEVGLNNITADVDKRAVSFGFKITLTTGTGTSPTLRTLQARLHPLGLADTVVRLPIDCGDVVSDLRGRDLKENGPGKGAARARALEALSQTRVKFQDVDWAFTRSSEIYDVVSVQIQHLATFDRKLNKQRPREIAVVTLRKRAK